MKTFYAPYQEEQIGPKQFSMIPNVSYRKVRALTPCIRLAGNILRNTVLPVVNVGSAKKISDIILLTKFLFY